MQQGLVYVLRRVAGEELVGEREAGVGALQERVFLMASGRSRAIRKGWKGKS